jgi:hypothetical protein
MTDPKRRLVDFEDPSQFAPEYPAKVKELLREDIWRIDAEQFPSDDGCRDHTSAVPNLWFSQSLDRTTDPATCAASPRSSGRRWPVRLVVLAGFVSVMAGLLVTLWGRSDQTLGARNGRDKASSLSRLSASVTDNSQEAKSAAARLIIAATPGALRSDEAAPIGLAVDGAADGAQLLIGGFATGSLFSVGKSIGQNAWRVPASQIEAATIMPPRGFVGSMNMAVALMLANGSLADRGALRLDWLPPASALGPSGTLSRRIDARQLDALLARGNVLEVTGDLAGARLVFQRAAEAGNARATFMLAETYDPIVLEKLGELGLASDVKAARIWYGKAKELGSEEALQRLQRLAHRSD